MFKIEFSILICVCSVMDSTIAPGAVGEGSNPSKHTKKENIWKKAQKN